MTAEQTYFLQCLADYCQKQTSAAPSEQIDLETLFQIAKDQSLDGILYEQIKEYLGQQVGTGGFEQSVIQEAYFSVNREVLLKEVAESFLQEGIPFICMKGAVLRDLYPTPELRSMGDIDLIIKSEDRQISDSIMSDKLGYRKFVDNHDVWTYDLGTFEFEIHDHMFYEHLTNHVDYKSYFDQIWDHAKLGEVFGFCSPNMYVPDEAFHFLYLMTHTAKHVVNKGMGFRAYLDMIFLSRRIKTDKEWNWIREELEKLQLLDFTRVCFAFCERWFGEKMPLKPMIPEETFYQKVMEKTFQDGTFGLNNQENTGANATKEILRDDRDYLRSSLKLTMSKLFPPYEDMQLIPWYSFVDGRPWLLPAAWIYRWFYCARHKLSHGADLLTEPLLRKEKILQRQDYLQKWGL